MRAKGASSDRRLCSGSDMATPSMPAIGHSLNAALEKIVETHTKS